MIHQSILSCIGHTPLVELSRVFPNSRTKVIAKLEFLNPGGSVKDRSAHYIVEHGLQTGVIGPHSHLIESSSGNFGIALAMMARLHNVRFTCVVDPNISSSNLQIMQQLGAHVDMVDTKDMYGGYLHTRIQRVQTLLTTHENSFWINQYANQLNWQAHYHRTAEEILDDLDEPIDYFIAAVSTTGTLMGIARRLRQRFPNIRIVAVDAEGSVIFGAPSKSRYIPGIGSSRVPELLCFDEIDQVVYVNDLEMVEGCHRLAATEGFLAGGSSGAVIAALSKLLPTIAHPCQVLTLLPDRGERYLNTIYSDAWVTHLHSMFTVNNSDTYVDQVIVS